MESPNMQDVLPEEIPEISQHFENTLVQGATMADLRDDLIERAKDQASSLNSHHAWRGLDNEALLENARLARFDARLEVLTPTVAGLLLFGKDSSLKAFLPHRAIEARAQALDPEGYDEQEIFQTNLIESFDRLMDFAVRNLPEGGQLAESPHSALRDVIFREIISNLLVHRDYESTSSARLTLRRDRVILENPCRTTRQGLLDLGRPESFPKNPVIFGFFKEIGLTKQPGGGLQVLKQLGEAYFGAEPLVFDRTLFKIFAPTQLAYSVTSPSPFQTMQDLEQALRSEQERAEHAKASRLSQFRSGPDGSTMATPRPDLDAFQKSMQDVEAQRPKDVLERSTTMHGSSDLSEAGMHDESEGASSGQNAPMQAEASESHQEPVPGLEVSVKSAFSGTVQDSPMQVSKVPELPVEPPAPSPRAPAAARVTPSFQAPSQPRLARPEVPPLQPKPSRIQSLGALISNKVRWVSKGKGRESVSPLPPSSPVKSAPALTLEPTQVVSKAPGKKGEPEAQLPKQASSKPDMQDVVQDAMQDGPKANVQAERIQKILIFCQNPRNREEIQNHVGLHNRDYFRKEILLPLLQDGRLVATIPDKPNSPKQQYRTPG